MPARLTCPMAGVLTLMALVFSPFTARADDVLVFAAASLKTALDEIAAEWSTSTGNRVRISYAGSAQLARQIERGAPADIFISASLDWMAYLEQAGLVRGESRTDLLGNSLVLIAHGDRASKIDLGDDVDLASLLGNEKLAMALVDAVPVGIYGKAALEHLGQWQAVAPKVAQTDNARSALALVSSGEAPYGIVYATDALADDKVRVAAVFPKGSHPLIVYPAALIRASVSAEAAAFFETLAGASAAARFEAQGFEIHKGRGDG